LRQKPEISIVIPAYNEEGNIEVVVDRLTSTLNSIKNLQIIFVNDGSSDNTLAELKKLSKRDSRIHFVSFSKNFGHQAALKAGIDFANGDCVISMDADMQHPPSLITEMIKYWKEGYDVVYTQRTEDKDLSFFKKITSKYFYFLLRKMSDVPIEQGTADFRLLDNKVADIIRKSNDPFLFIRGFVPWMGFNQKKIVYKPDERFSGSSKYTLKKMLNFAINGITGFSIKPLRFATFLGISISLLAFLYAIYAISIYFVNAQIISGWASLLTSVLFIGGIQLIILGIIGEYIGKIYIQLKNRPFYIVNESSIDKI
jgi:glycosyltransferase involved in cell wall biosynthesis